MSSSNVPILSKDFNFIRDEINVFGEKICVVDDVSSTKLIQYFLNRLELELKEEEPFYLFDVFDIFKKYTRWKQYFPRVIPFYAIKCHPHPLILKILSNLGIGFDCASQSEKNQVLGYNVSPDRIIYANPCKFSQHLKYASENHVHKMTFDSSAELYKIKENAPDASLILRVFVETTTARCPLGLKFGAPLDSVPSLVRLVKQLGLNLIGVSFHVGSGCTDADVYRKAIEDSRYVFDFARSEGIHMKLLDIGGGFPGDFEYECSEELFQQIAHIVNTNIDKYFKEEDGYIIISEPGRFFVASAMQLVTTVIAEANDNDPNSLDLRSYYLNDGVHGSFNCTVFDHFIGESFIIPKSELIETNPRQVINTYIGTNSQKRPENELSTKLFLTTLRGLTGESNDICIEKEMLPEINVGDIIVFKNMGAYTRCAASTFSGHSVPRTFDYIRMDDLNSISYMLENINSTKYK